MSKHPDSDTGAHHGKKRSHFLNVRLDEGEREQFKKLADDAGVRPATFARALLMTAVHERAGWPSSDARLRMVLPTQDILKSEAGSYRGAHGTKVTEEVSADDYIESSKALDAQQQKDILRFTAELRKVGANINQIARRMNYDFRAGVAVDGVHDDEAVSLGELHRLMREILARFDASDTESASS